MRPRTPRENQTIFRALMLSLYRKRLRKRDTLNGFDDYVLKPSTFKWPPIYKGTDQTIVTGNQIWEARKWKT